MRILFVVLICSLFLFSGTALSAEKFYNTKYPVSEARANSNGSVTVYYTVVGGTRVYLKTTAEDDSNNKTILAIALSAIATGKLVRLSYDDSKVLTGISLNN